MEKKAHWLHNFIRSCQDFQERLARNKQTNKKPGENYTAHQISEAEKQGTLDCLGFKWHLSCQKSNNNEI